MTLNSSRLCRFLVYWPILVLPLILGSARAFLWSFIASVFMAGFALLLLTSREFFLLPVPRSSLLVPCFLFLPILAYPFLQIVPLPLPLLSVLSPQRAEWVQRSIEATGVSCWWASLSYAPLDTFMSALWILTLALFALVLHRSMREGIIEPKRLLVVLFVVAGLEALYGIIQVLVPSTGLGFCDGASGTFANRDHYAAFLGMIWPLQLVWLLGPAEKHANNGPWGAGRPSGSPVAGHQSRVSGHELKGISSYDERRSWRNVPEQRIFFIFLTGIVLLGLIFSRSRGGIISLIIGTTVLVFLGGNHRRSIIPALIGCWAIILAYGSIIGFEGIIKRFTEIGHDALGRLKIWQFTWRLIRDHWLTGTGAGTYSPVVFLYQDFDTDLVQVGHAHNDYLEIASEWGLPLCLFIIFMTWGYWLLTARCEAIQNYAGPGERGDQGKRTQRGGKQGTIQTGEKLIRVGALAGSAAFLSHAWVDFNWQIPANQLYFIVLLVLMRYTGTGEGLGVRGKG